MDRSFRCEEIHLDGHAVLAVHGEIDASTSPELGEACSRLASLTNHIVLDFSAVTFVDSSGLRLLIRLERSDPAVSVRIRNVPAQVRRVFEITGLAEAFLESVPPAPPCPGRVFLEGETGIARHR